MSRGYLFQNDDFSYTIGTRVMTAEVDVIGGIDKGLCCYVTGEATKQFGSETMIIPKIGIASIDDSSTLPIFAIVIEDGTDGQAISVVNNGIVSGVLDTSGWTLGDTLYLTENGIIDNQPTQGVEGIIQVGAVTKVGVTDGSIELGIQHFTAIADFPGVLRNTLLNESNDVAAASAWTAKNDLDHYASFGITGSNFSLGGSSTFVFGQGFGPFDFVNDGNTSFRWWVDETDSHNFSVVQKMELSAAGFLSLLNGGIAVDRFLDEDDFASDSDEALATQQSIKSFIKSQQAHGTMAQHGQSTTVTITTQFTWVDIDSGYTDGSGDGVVFQNSKELKVVNPGVYILNWNISVKMAMGGSVAMIGGITLNGTIDLLTTAHANIAAANDLVNISGTADLTLVEDDLIRLALINLSGTTDFVVEHAAITMSKVQD